MGYALLAQRKLVSDSQLNSTMLQQTQRSNEQYQLAANTLSLQQRLGSLQASQADQLEKKYAELAEANDSDKRASIQAEIESLQAGFKKEEDAINRQIYLTAVKENSIEMEVKRLDTQVSALQKQLEAIEQAESAGIDRATPKFNGVG